MRTARFFVPGEWVALQASAFSIPASATYKQIVTILRMKVGDAISLMVNDGTEIEGAITAITSSAVLGTISGTTQGQSLLPDVTVCCAILKNDHFELVLEKCTELGVTAFLPLLTDRTIKKTSNIPPRWTTIVREASEQSGRTILPVIHEPIKFSEALVKTDGMRRVLFHEAMGDGLPAFDRTDRIAIFTGPEGGFTENEVTQAKDASSHLVHLGDTVLRAETAAIAATALIRLA